MSRTIITHPAACVERAAAELAAEHRAAGDESAAQRVERAAADIRAGATLAVVAGGYEASSGSERGLVYTIDAITGACTCVARGACKHQARIELLERAALYVVPTLAQVQAQELAERTVRRDAAIADMLELYPERAPSTLARRPAPRQPARAAA
jgi:hypothetical protein